jgi:serine/threonine protein phosphatase PrpC
MHYDFIAVFDGHGDTNKKFMNTIKELPIKDIIREAECPAKAIHKLLIDKYFPINAGTTFICAKIFSDNVKITSVGDSTAYLYINNKLTYKTTEHLITNPVEKQRLISQSIKHVIKQDMNCNILSPTSIEMDKKNFYKIKFIKDYNECWISMTQSIGHQGITGIEPETNIIYYNPEDKVDLIVATDGLWDIFNPETIKQDYTMVLNFSSIDLVNEAEKRWKQPWELHSDGIVYSEQSFPPDNYDDISVGIWRRFTSDNK